MNRSSLLGSSWAEGQNLNMQEISYRNGEHSCLLNMTSTRARILASFFCIANEFGKYDYDESKAIPIDLLTKQSLIALPTEDTSPHSAYIDFQSSYLVDPLWISHIAEGQRAASAQWKSSNASNVSRFMNPFDSCVFFPCGLLAKQIPSQPFPSMKWLAVV